MDPLTTKIQEIISSDFSIGGFVTLVREVLSGIQFVAPDNFRKERSNFSYNIDGYYHVGNYKTADNKKIIVAAVQVAKRSTVELARSIQRNYAKKLIQNSNSNAAFVAFYTLTEPSWRLSFVCLDTGFTVENGKFKTIEEMTPAKRYSFLVGSSEPYHTAVDRLMILVRRNETPKLADIEEAFSVEKVTNDFYKLYCEKFLQLRDYLDGNPAFIEEAELHNFTSVQFAKKLMGQIVFLYFLQKKGWLGVKAWPKTLTSKEYNKALYARGQSSQKLIPNVYRQVSEDVYHVSKSGLESLSNDEEELLSTCVKGEPWGSGPKDFMRRLFELAKKKGENFFDTYLEPLFYEALNVNRGEQGYCSELHCRIPFLSGGLFEPIEGYDWKHTDFAVPNEIFSNRINDNSRTGDGILDFFDCYNFTMSEDEPMEREVAVDPEMLGKVFENLLDVNDRHTTGSFYTPREIVHYMCQESLINYLTRAMVDIPEQDIREFILYSDFMKDQDSDDRKRAENGGLFISECLLKLDDKGKVIVNRLEELDNALKTVRVADPAVGSGAFPLGMLNEIVKARSAITEYMIIAKKTYAVSVEQGYAFSRIIHQNRTQYILKKETIRDCIYAADIEPSAVDIAQLRLWLSLVIDDEITPDAQSELDGHRNPTPLPNLECNILCGNSLIDEFEGFKLINPSYLTGTTAEGQQINLGQEIYDSILEKLISEQRELFYCENTDKKKQLLENIDYLRDQIILHQLDKCSPEVLEKYEESKHMASKPYVLWQLDFARVFREKGGFDIVIGNPPYVQLQKAITEDGSVKLGDLYERLHFNTFAKTGDIYCLFYEKGWQLIHKNGILTFITSNKWMRAGYGKALRAFIANNANPLLLIDFAGQKIFESATVDVNILLFSKSENSMATKACIANEECRNSINAYVEKNSTVTTYDTEDSWVVLNLIEESIKKKIEKKGVPLKEWDIQINYGIKTGFNDAFIISGEKKDELIKADPKSAEIIRPILRGRDIKRYEYSFADQWIIATFPSRKYDIDCYPAVKKHLLQFGVNRLEQTGKVYFVNGEKIKARKKTNNKWYETQDSISYWDVFSKQKIIWGNLCLSAQFAFADENLFINAPSPMIVPGDKYLLAVLNSSIADWYIRGLGVTRNGGYFEYKPMFIEKLPVPRLKEENKKPFEQLVDEILDCKGRAVDTIQLEKRINKMVYNLYDLTEHEVIYIESLISPN